MSGAPPGDLFAELQWRDLVHTATEELPAVLAREKLTGYIGFDPSAASLHVGSLLPVMGLARLQRFGHAPIAIVGGGTGMIGDPSGKTQERQLLTKEQIEQNLLGIRAQLEPFLDFGAAQNPARIVNNADWLTTVGLTDFLRDVGKYFTVNAMLAKESVKRRMGGGGDEAAGESDGISFTEFSYMLLQAYDFLELYDRYGCRLQMGGSDQWGNIVAGIDLIRRLRAPADEGRGPKAEKRAALAFGLVFPLVTNAQGTKFGKTEAGAVWLDPRLTSPFRFYQFWLNTDDRDVVTYLKYFTWLDEQQVGELAELVRTDAARREAQRRLAREVTSMVHGPSALAAAERATKVLFGGDVAGLAANEIEEIFSEAPSSSIGADALGGDGMPVADLIVASGLVASKGEARRMVDGGGLYLNGVRLSAGKRTVTTDDAVDGRFLVLRKGQKNHHLVRIAEA
ncbi:MAG TPA: tyrosine--tRNA ligase [Thermoanaerobaculia bacterium]|nr:tyrosine--tRNA ligase [Thermoanaerobaculia bacterium]